MPTTYAMLTGINYFKTPNELRGCLNDKDDMQALLLQNGVPQENITTLSDDLPKSDPRYPSRNNILTQLRAVARKAQPGDTLIFSYSGHGTYSRDRSGDELDRRDEAICPADNTTISDDELNAELRKLNKDVKCFVIMDCCHSGSILDLRYGLKQETSRLINNNHGFTVMISGCQDDQTSADAAFAVRGVERADQPNKREIVERGEDRTVRYRGALTAAFMDTVAKLGFNRVLNDCFSGSKSLMRNFRDKMLKWLRNGGFDQVPNIAYEGYLPTNYRAGEAILNGFNVGKHVLRNTPARQAHFAQTAEPDAHAVRRKIR